MGKPLRLRIDRFGRVVLPKKLRDSYGLRTGAWVELRAEPGGILLEPVEAPPALVASRDLLIYTGEWPEGLDLAAELARTRDERLDGLA